MSTEIKEGRFGFYLTGSPSGKILDGLIQLPFTGCGRKVEVPPTALSPVLPRRLNEEKKTVVEITNTTQTGS